MTDDLRRLAKLAYSDTGALAESPNYTTVVMFHGFGWHGATFLRMQPFAAKYNARLLLVNRRDYPGSEPYEAAERDQLAAARIAPSPDALSLLQEYMRNRAQEIVDFLSAFVEQEHVPFKSDDGGGIILCGWSLGGSWITALLANLDLISSSDVDLGLYVRRTVLYDPPSRILGYPHPPDPYSPLFDDEIMPEKRAEAFAAWVSGYYNHRMTKNMLERRTPVTKPRPTIETMKSDEVGACFSKHPTGPDGSDTLLVALGFHQLFSHLRKNALYFNKARGAGPNDWRDVPLRYLWGDRSVYEVPWGALCVLEELAETMDRGRIARNISVTRITGANHFLNWDNPERLLCAVLADNDETIL